MTDLAGLQMTLRILGGIRIVDEWMHAANLFERHKCFCRLEWFTMEAKLKAGADKREVFRQVVTILRKSDCPERPVVIYCPDNRFYWRDPEIKMISTGKQFAMLEDYLKLCDLDWIKSSVEVQT